jgi:hypothetical protein
MKNDNLIAITNTIISELRQLEGDITLMQIQINGGKFELENQTTESMMTIVTDYNNHLQNIKFMEGKFDAFSLVLKKINEIQQSN